MERIQEETTVSETVESDVFGSILHKVMEELYQPYRGREVTADLLKMIRQDKRQLTDTIARAFADYVEWPENDDRFLREIDKLVRRLSPWQTPVIESTKRTMEWD